MTAIESTFRMDQPALGDLLGDIHQGTLQLPDFQRGWVWDDNHIRALIASISMGYPIGALMFMETGGDLVRFKPRLLEGVELDNPPKPDKLVLDGQQRLTSLYLSLLTHKPVPTTNDKKQEIKRVYYLDMNKCLDPEVDRFDAIVSLPPDRMLKSEFGRKVDLDISSREKEYVNGFLPLSMIFDLGGYSAWKTGFREHFDHDKDKSRFLDRFDNEVWLRLQKYKVPIIELLNNTPKEAVCQVFEQVNTGGVKLTVFELLTATYAADDFPLRQNWLDHKQRLDEYKVLSEVDETTFLTAVTLLTSYKRNLEKKGAVSCKRKDVLGLTLDDYRANSPVIIEGLIMASRFLARHKIFDDKSLPYPTQLIPLSAVCAVLGKRFEEEPVRQKLAKWFWCGVFGELYGGANETRYALDMQNLPPWVDGENEPATVRDANFAPIRLLTLQSRLSSAYKGIAALLMQAGSRDFISGDKIELTTYFEQAIDIHHIFPRAYCLKQGFKTSLWNSIINKGPLTARTNRILGGNAPSTYVKRIQTDFSLGPQMLDAHVQTHLIDPERLRKDDFEVFARDRASKLLDLVESAMSKTVTGRDSDEVIAAFGGKLETD